MADPTNWKRRYLEEAQAWESSEQLLRRVLGRLVIAAEGASEELDEVLARIQRHARNREDEPLAQALEDLTVQIKRLDSPPSSSATVAAGSSAAKSGAAAAPKPEPKRDLARSGPPASPEAPVRGPTARVSPVREVLITLIDELVVAQPGITGLETVRETLQRDTGGDWHRPLERVIAEIRGLIQRISSDKHALEQLMLEVSDELGGITRVLEGEQNGLREGRERTLALHEIMTDGVQAMQTHIERETDIGRLKAAVGQSLESIRTGISDFVEKDAQRFAEAETANRELRERVSRMESETRELRTQIDRDRAKLMFDALTGVRSRLAYDETLAQQISRYRRYNETFCLAVLDIDFFKRVNDEYGHAAGDKALAMIAGVLDERIRKSDFLFRIGGEEFVLLLPHVELTRAAPIVDALREAVAAAEFHYEEIPVPLTISAGLTGVRVDDTAETIFTRADDALYRAKKAGRNCLVTLE